MLVVTTGITHRRSGIQQQEENHGAPAYHIEAVDGDQKPERRNHEFAKRLASDHGRLPPGVLCWETVAVGISARLVGTGGSGVFGRGV